MKQGFYLLLFIVSPVLLAAQMPEKDSVIITKDTGIVIKDSLLIRADSLAVLKDSMQLKTVASVYEQSLKRILQANVLIKTNAEPVSIVTIQRNAKSDNLLFYLLTGIVFCLAFLRFFYSRYFDNLFRVFFNTSLRQSQLTDQLLQAKQVSLFFNILFILTGGIFIYLLLLHYNWITTFNRTLNLSFCIISLAAIYFIKYLLLKFTGWVTGNKEVVNTYLFIIFLINKILSILLLPLVIVIAFSSPALQNAAVLISLLMIGLLFLFRFLRSYGLLQNQIKVGRFHFFMYIIGVELLPLLLIYKGLLILLNKNL